MSDPKDLGIFGRSTLDVTTRFSEEHIESMYKMTWEVIFNYNETWRLILRRMLFLTLDENTPVSPASPVSPVLLASFYQTIHSMYRMIMRDPSRTTINTMLPFATKRKNLFYTKMDTNPTFYEDSENLKVFIEENYQFVITEIKIIIDKNSQTKEDVIRLIVLNILLVKLTNIIETGSI